MHRRGPQPTATALLTAMLLVASGCKGCDKDGALHAADAGPLEPPLTSDEQVYGPDTLADYLLLTYGEEFMAFDTRLVSLAGKIDVSNRYRAAVGVHTTLSPSETKGCSGVVVGPRVVLTAGHCVCGQQAPVPGDDGARLITAATCAESALVENTFYLPIQGSAETGGSRIESSQGRVRPHPELRVALDKNGHLISSKADLAVILLDRRLDKGVRPVSLAETEVQAGEPITVVGYGYDEFLNVYGSDRRFSENKFVKFLSPDSPTGLLDQPLRHRYRQDSGGPCFRENGKELTLVGVSSRSLGEGETFTSIYGYRNWVRDEIKRAPKGN